MSEVDDDVEEAEPPAEGDDSDEEDDDDERTGAGDTLVVTDAQPCRFEELRGGCKCESRGDEVEEARQDEEENLAWRLVFLGAGSREHAQALSATAAAAGPWRWVGRRAEECRARNMSAGRGEKHAQKRKHTENSQNPFTNGHKSRGLDGETQLQVDGGSTGCQRRISSRHVACCSCPRRGPPTLFSKTTSSRHACPRAHEAHRPHGQKQRN